MYRIAIDAGHGSKDPGAVNGIYEEADIALEIALRVGSEAQSRGWEVVYTRENDTFVELYNRCKIANNADCDCFVSIHLNSADSKQANGTETLVYGPNRSATRLAEIVNRNMVNATGFRDRGVKYRSELCVLKHTKMPAILVETGFISNNEEVKALISEAIELAIAKAICDGIQEWREESERT